MSQRGRSGFLSYLLLLSRLLQFEHRAEEVAPTSGPRGSQGGVGRARRAGRRPGGRGGWGLPPPPTASLSPQPNSSSWRGELSGPAATVLCLHGAQNNLSALQLAVL